MAHKKYENVKKSKAKIIPSPRKYSKHYTKIEEHTFEDEEK